MRTIKREIVSALLISKDEKIFMGKKHPKKGGVYVDCWHIPGGGIDEGEDEETALIREIQEEVGLDISTYSLILVDDLGSGSSNKILANGEEVVCNMKFNVYQVNIKDLNSDEIKISLDDDLEEYCWVPVKDLGKYKLTPPSVSLFQRLGYLK